eukprot:Nk52_evm12s372 gene=Nk52_evmTU12s372
MEESAAAEHQSLVEQFISLTGESEERAVFFLESSNWELELALGNFFENQEEQAQPVNNSNNQAEAFGEENFSDEESVFSSAQPQSQSVGFNQQQPEMTSGGSSSGGWPGAGKKEKKKFATLGDFGNADSSDDEQENNRYFAGGGSGGRSGQLIEGNDKRNPDDVIKQMFQRARDNGAEDLEELEERKKQKQPAFGGGGRRLGDTLEEPVESESTAPVTTGPGHQEEESAEPVTRVLTFWRDGFSVDDGPLRHFDDPANKEFLEDVNRGVAPRELSQSRGGSRRGEVHINLVDRRTEEFVAPKKKFEPFAGTGNKLGNPVPEVAGAGTSSSSAAHQSAKVQELNIDESQPVTSIQIRLGDGTRLVSKFNTTHTVGDIRDFIRSAKPDTRAFTLMTTFPRKELNEDSETIADAKLNNAVIVQQYK